MKHAYLYGALASALLATTLGSGLSRAADQPSKDQKQSQYPNATRTEPKLDLTSKEESKNLNDGLQAAQAGDKAKALQLLQPIADNSKSKYAQAIALQELASLKYDNGNGDTKAAIALLKQSLDNGVLPNDSYFQLEYELAQLYTADGQYQASLDTISKWRSEGRRETAESYALEGNDDYRLQKYAEAISAVKKAQSLTDKPDPKWNQILLASYNESGQTDKAAEVAQQSLQTNPNDPAALSNAVATLIQAQKYPEAIQLMEKERAQGDLKTEQEYVNLAKLHLMQAQGDSGDSKTDADAAVKVLQEGITKGVVPQSAGNYKLIGDAYEIGGEPDQALPYYRKAIPIATDGEAAVAAGTVLLGDNKYAEAKSLIQQGIDKGVKHKGNAYLLLANANIGLKDKAGATAAAQKAAQEPDTAAKASAWLKKNGGAK